MEKGLNYSDIYLIPEFSELRSRSEADISIEFLGKKFNAPWIPANMKSVIDIKTAKWLSENDYFYIYHRFGDTLEFIGDANDCKWKTVSIGIGVKQKDKDLILNILGYYNNITYQQYEPYKVDFITIDIAQGHHILVKEMIKYIKDTYNNTNTKCPKIIAGNVCTNEAALDLQEWGADAIKIGVGGGRACSTKDMTGFHVPMFTCVQECSKGIHIPIIADGAIKQNGDIGKALVGGADLIMIGALVSACTDAPGQNVYNAEMIITHKRYYGSASAKNKGENKHVEGFEVDLPCNGLTFEQKYQEMKESLQSAISYAGGNNLKAFRNVKWLTTK